MTTATMMYDYANDKWICLGVNLVKDVTAGARYAKSVLSKEGLYRFP